MTKDLIKAGKTAPEDWATFNLHSTDSIDYIYVLSGAITCVVGEQTINLNTGNFLAQIGPEHTWVNDNDEPCYILCVMCGIKPSGERKKMVLSSFLVLFFNESKVLVKTSRYVTVKKTMH